MTARAMGGPVDRSALDRLTRLAAWELNAPIACLSLVDSDRRLVTAGCGLSVPGALLVSWSFMNQVVASRCPLLVTDGLGDLVAAQLPAVHDGTVAAYLGMPLIASDGRAVGSVSVMDTRPRRWSGPQRTLLGAIAAWAVHEVEGVARPPRTRTASSP